MGKFRVYNVERLWGSCDNEELDLVKKKLAELGYKVEYFSGYDDGYYELVWK